MFGFLKRGSPDVDHAEPLPVSAAIQSIDDQMAAVVGATVDRRTAEQKRYLDRMLDARLFYGRVDASMGIQASGGGGAR